MKVLVTKKVPYDVIGDLKGFDVDYHDSDINLSYEEFCRRAKDADGVICMLGDRVDSSFLSQCSKLKVVANYAVGYNNIDIESAKKSGVTVCNTPHVLTEATAEIGFALMLSASRRFTEGEKLTRSREFHGWAADMLLGHGLYGKALGVFGFGRIGQAVARMSSGFNMKVIYNQRNRDFQAERILGAEYSGFDDLIVRSDYIVVAAPLTAETKYRFTAAEFKKMKKTAVFVNIGRGSIIKESDLADALKDGEIFAAGLDVYENEPVIEEKLYELDNVVLLPHIGSATVSTRADMGRLCCDSVRAVLIKNEKPFNTVK